MTHQVEYERRGIKAYRLAMAFEDVCKKRPKRMSRKVRATHAELMTPGFWVRLAEEYQIHPPSDQTIGLAIGILKARAGLTA